MHMTWLVNSAVHVWGSQPYDSGDNSRNNPLVALLVFGDVSAVIVTCVAVKGRDVWRSGTLLFASSAQL
jgi:hypothetical protein